MAAAWLTSTAAVGQPVHLEIIVLKENLGIGALGFLSVHGNFSIPSSVLNVVIKYSVFTSA